MGDPNNWAKFYKKYIESQIDRLPGLFVTFFFVSFLTFFLLEKLGRDPNTLDPINIGFVLILNLISSFVFWFLIRRISPFATDEVGILIALTKIDQEADKELLKLYANLNDIIFAEKTHTKVGIKLAPERLIPEREEQAYALRKKFRAKLIIWGNVDKGNIRSQKTTIFTQIRFSYEIILPNNSDRKILLANINSSIGSLLSQRNWIITDQNNIFDRNYIANNLKTISFYTIGLALFFAKYFKEAIDILSKVTKDYESQPHRSKDDEIALFNIRLIIVGVFNARIKYLELWPNSKNKQRDLVLAQKIIDELDVLKMSDTFILLKAQIAFATGDLNGARQFVKQAIREFPSDPAPYFSIAFIEYYIGDLTLGYSAVWDAINRNALKIGDQLVSLSLWYEKAIAEDPSKGYLNFPLGLIYSILKNDVIAKECLQKIVDLYQSDDRSICKKMVYHSQKIIRKIERRLK